MIPQQFDIFEPDEKHIVYDNIDFCLTDLDCAIVTHRQQTQMSTQKNLNVTF